MGDPKSYLSPDVTVDFTSINLEDNGKGVVSVSEVKGYKPTDTFKVAINPSKNTLLKILLFAIFFI